MVGNIDQDNIFKFLREITNTGQRYKKSKLHIKQNVKQTDRAILLS